jgi:hypothetical protein
MRFFSIYYSGAEPLSYSTNARGYLKNLSIDARVLQRVFEENVVRI